MSAVAERRLQSSPSILPLYARATAPLIPGASLLPFVPGRAKDVPDMELVLPDVGVDRERLAAYARVCGFALRATLPATYPHMLAFPLHMALMTDGSFPFGAVGLVHVENSLTQHRPIGVAETLELRVRATPLQSHPAGRTFALVSEARVGDELVWEETSTMLRRGGGSGERGPRSELPELPAATSWKLPGDLGRRYAAVSGDRNPIHMSPLSAKLFGFPRTIAHGMWSAARCLAALEPRLPDAFTQEVRFRKPILLPATVAFGSATDAGGTTHFSLRDARKGTPHLDGTTTGA